jgi:hypothetical protein
MVYALKAHRVDVDNVDRCGLQGIDIHIARVIRVDHRQFAFSIALANDRVRNLRGSYLGGRVSTSVIMVIFLR